MPLKKARVSRLTGENVITTPGEHIIIWTDDGAIKKYKRINVSDVYPKTIEATEPPTEPATGGTVTPADEEYEIVPVSSDLNWAAVFEDISNNESMGDNDICILFDTNDDSAFNSSNKPHIYTWRGAGNTAADRNAEYKSKPAMKQYGTTVYYYYVCDKKFTNFIISNYSGDDNAEKGYVKVMDSTALDSGYKYYVFRAGKDNYVWESDSAGDSKVGGKDITEMIDIEVPDGKLCIFFDTQGSVDQPYIHYWGGTDHTTWGTLTAMTKFHDYNNYYYVLISDSNKGFLIARDSAGSSKVVTGDGTLEEKSSGGRYSYYIVRAKSDGKSYNVTSYETTPSVVVEEPEEVEGMISGLPMAYVGGGRIRVKNKSYVDTYGTGKKWNSMSSSGKYDTEAAGGTASLTGVPRCIIVYKDGDGTSYGTESPKIYLWKRGGTEYTSWSDRPTMTYLGESGTKHYFYIVVDSYFNKFKLTNLDGSYETGDCSLNSHEVQIINGVGGSIVSSGSKTSITMPSGLSLPEMTLPAAGSIDYSEAKSKVEGTLNGTDKMTLSNSWLFGGYGSNHASDNRVGDSKLLPYYDWYEYKIPVEQSNVYTFEVWGLDPNDKAKNNKTPRIKKVYGDVWVNLYNDEGTTGNGTALDGSTKSIKTFKYTELSTFDPEKIMTTEKINVYFRMPVDVNDPTHKWQNVRISQAHGTGAKAYGGESTDIATIQQNVEMKELKGGRVSGAKTGSGIIRAHSVVICTGGLSYPLTGSTGDGYRFAAKAGMNVTKLQPSLVPLECSEEYCRELQGLSLRNVTLSLFEDGKLVFKELGEMLFTHFGVSGPLVLTASSRIRDLGSSVYTLEIDLKPALDEKKLDARILRDFEKYSNREFKNSLNDLVPSSLAPVLVSLTGIEGDMKTNSVTREQRKRLLRLMKAFPLSITGKRPAEEAIVTSGGVDTKEINPRTMESKKVPGLYFAGEVLDLDAYTGGYNLQIAWSTGRAAGRAVKGEKDEIQ